MPASQVEDGCPGDQGLEPPTQTQGGRTPERPVLPTTQPQALFAKLKDLWVGTTRKNKGALS